MGMPRKRFFWKLDYKMGGVNQYEPGESYTKLYFFFKLNENHSYIPLKVGMKSLVKQFLTNRVRIPEFHY